MSIYTDEFNALNSLIGALGSDTISAGNSYELAKIQQLQKIAGLFKLEAIATGESIKTDSLGNFVPANFADSIHAHSHLDSLVGSKPAKTFLAAPTDTLGEPTYRQIAIADIPEQISSLAGSTYATEGHTHPILDSLVGAKPAKTFLSAPTDTLGNPSYRQIVMGDLPGQLASLSGGSFAPVAHAHAIADLPTLVGAAIAINAQRLFWASPNSGSGTPSFRGILVNDLPSVLARQDFNNYYSGSQQLTPVSVNPTSSITLDAEAGTWFVVAPLTTGTTIQIPSNAINGKGYRLILSIQQSATPLIVDWSTSFKFQNRTKPIATTNPGGWDEFLLISPNGVDWLVSTNVSYGSL